MVRLLRSAPGGAGQIVRVQFAPGTYVLTEPWRLTPEDSGSAQAPIVYTSAGRSSVRFSGGGEVGPWKVVQKGGRDVWTVSLDAIARGDSELAKKLRTTHELFVGVDRKVLAREPDQGYLKVRDVPDVAAGTPWHQGTRYFGFEEQDRQIWAHAEGGECVAFTRWVDMYLSVERPELDKGIGKFKNPTTFLLGAGDLYFLQNREEYMDEPGEWFIDAGGVLNYLPKAGERPESSPAVIPVQGRLLDLAGKPEQGKFVEHVKFENLAFEHCRWWFGDSAGETWPSSEVVGFKQAAWGVPGAVVGEGVRHVEFNDCEVSHVAGYGIELGRGCSDNTISHCVLFDLGAGGIKIGEAVIRERQDDRSAGNTVCDSVVNGGGYLHRQAVGVWIGQSGDNRLVHNAIMDMGYTGISIGWTWGYGPSLAGGNIVEANEVGFIGKREQDTEPVLGDMAGIYTLGTQIGTVIRGNYFHDIAGRSIAWGIYFDEGSTGIVAEGNVVLRTTHGSFHQHYGKDNIVRRNLLCFGRDAQLWRTRREEHNSFTLEDNVIIAENDKLLAGDWSDRFISRGNIYWRTDGGQPAFPGGIDLGAWQATGKEAGSAVADPGFELGQDLLIRNESAAGKLGWTRFAMDAVGPRKGTTEGSPRP